jgi:hypothetical protein
MRHIWSNRHIQAGVVVAGLAAAWLVAAAPIWGGS